MQCNENGKCQCKTGFAGDKCDRCKHQYSGRECNYCQNGYYNFPSCRSCDCNMRYTEVCNKINGACKCINNYGGRSCDECADLSYGFPNCKGKESKILLFKLYMHVFNF